LSCPFGGFARRRHDALARLLQALCEEAGFWTDWLPHPEHLYGEGEDGGDAEPDLEIRIPGEPALFVDIAIVLPGRALRVEGRKRTTYQVWAERRRVCVPDFSPIVFEHHGRIGDQSLATLTKLARAAATRRGLNPNAEVRRWLELLGTRLQLEQARVLLEG